MQVFNLGILRLFGIFTQANAEQITYETSLCMADCVWFGQIEYDILRDKHSPMLVSGTTVPKCDTKRTKVVTKDVEQNATCSGLLECWFE